MEKSHNPILKNKKLLFAHWNSEDKEDYSYQNWYITLKPMFKKVVTFSPKKNYFNHGKDEMNRLFLELVKKEKPDYIFFLLLYDEFYPETILKVKEISPKTKTLNLFGDDSWRYDDFTRYYSLLFDHCITAYHKAVPFYIKDNVTSVSFTCGVDLDVFKHLNLQKKYDVVFIGRPGEERVRMLKFLIQNGIKVDIWGHGWESYPEFKGFYHGSLKSSDWVRTVNESRINLSFTQGGFNIPQIKGRPFEVSACKSFCLVGFFSDYRDFFKKNELVMFKNENDLLAKIRYYLSNEKERERIEERAYKRVAEKYNLSNEIIGFFDRANKNEKLGIYNLNISKYKIAHITQNDLINNNFREKLKNVNYVSILQPGVKPYANKDLFQVYSLIKSKKKISCCDYYVNSPSLGNYMLFKSKLAFNKIGSKKFHLLSNNSQLIFEKKYFIKNFEKIKEYLFDKSKEIMNEKNTIFVSVPLVEVPSVISADYDTIKKAFQMRFLDKLYSIKYKKNIFSLYPINLFLESLKGKRFILASIKDSLGNKSKINKLIRGF